MGTRPAVTQKPLSFGSFLILTISVLLFIVPSGSALSWDTLEPICRSITEALPWTTQNVDLGISEIVDSRFMYAPSEPTPNLSIDFTTTAPELKASAALGMPDIPRPAVIMRRGSMKEKKQTVVQSKSSLTFGYILDAGATDNDRLALDLFVPAHLDALGTFFLETRSEHQNLFRWGGAPDNRRWDLSVGVGFRKLWGTGFLIGANYFIDSSRTAGEWSSSVGFGFETGGRFSIDNEVDFNLNIYRGGGIDAEVGYTFPVSDDLFDLRLKLAKYRFYDGEYILGWKTGADLFTADRTFAVTYEYGQDSRDPSYHSIALSALLPMRLGNIFQGKNPFYKPEPFNRDARNKRSLVSARVKRSWRQPTTVVAARNTDIGRRWSTPGKVRWGIVRWSDSKTDDSSKTEKESKEYRKPADQCRHCCCPCCCEKKSCGDSDDSSDSLFAKAGVYGVGLVALGTYTVSDYMYRSAFGPFEDDPSELKRPKRGKR